MMNSYADSVLHERPKQLTHYEVKVNSANMQQTIAVIEKNINSFSGSAFEYFFLDDLFNAQYKPDNILARYLPCLPGLPFL